MNEIYLKIFLEMMMNEKTISRRQLLKNSFGYSLAALAGASVLPTLLSGCRGCKLSDPGTPVDHAELEKDFVPCPVYSDLTEQQKLQRTRLKYVDKTPVATRRCENCKLYRPHQKIAGNCCGCQVVAGPVHPKGYCISWIRQM